MWSFYYDVVKPSTEVSAETGIFIALTIMTGLMIMLPSYFEKKRTRL